MMTQPDFFAPSPPAPTVFPAVEPPVSRSLAAVLVAEQRKADAREERLAPLTHEIVAHIQKALARGETARPRVVAPLSTSFADYEWPFFSGHVDDSEAGLRLSDEDRRFAFSAEGAFHALCVEKTGETAEPKRLTKWRKEAATLLNQSHQIADKLTRAGFNAYRETPFSVWRYFVQSGHVERLPMFRRCLFIPYVAQAVRAPMVAALESFIERHPFCRMWTMSSGQRVPMREIRERARWMHGKLSDLNAEPFMRAAGVEIVFRSTELGTPEWNEDGTPRSGGLIEEDDDGQMYFHVHSHCVVWLKKGFIPNDEWSALLDRVGAFWVHWWKDGGTDRNGKDTSGLIVNPREVCKYVTKPGEMLKLTGPQLVELQEQLSRLKLCQPMGELADEINRRKDPENPLRLVRRNTEDGPVYVEVKNWNKRNRRTDTEKHQDAAAKLDRREAIGALQIVSRGLPRIGPAGIAEPVVTVMAMKWDTAEVQRAPVVQRLYELTRAKFLAARISVHTCTSTVGNTVPMPFEAAMDPPKVPLSGAEIAGFAR